MNPKSITQYRIDLESVCFYILTTKILIQHLKSETRFATIAHKHTMIQLYVGL